MLPKLENELDIEIFGLMQEIELLELFKPISDNNLIKLNELYASLVTKFQVKLANAVLNLANLEKELPKTIEKRGKKGFDYTNVDNYGHDAFCWNVRNTRVEGVKESYINDMISAAKKHKLEKIKRLQKDMWETIRAFRDEDYRRKY